MRINFLSHNCDISQTIKFTFEVCCSVRMMRMYSLSSSVLMKTAYLTKQTGTHLFCQTKEHQMLATGNLIRSVQKIIAKCFPNIKQSAAIHGNNLFFKGGKTLTKKAGKNC